MAIVPNFEVTKTDYKGIKKAYSDEKRDFLLNGDVVENLTGTEYQDIINSELCDAVLKTYIDNEMIYIESDLGIVTIENKGIKSCIHHINDNFSHSKIRRSIFSAIKPVLEHGCIILPLDNYKDDIDYKAKKTQQGRKQRGRTNRTGMIAAPIEIAGERYICGIIVKETNCLDEKGYPSNQIRLNITDACLLNEINQLCSSALGPVSTELNNSASTTLAGYCAKLIISFITCKSVDLNIPKVKDNASTNSSNKYNSSSTTNIRSLDSEDFNTKHENSNYNNIKMKHNKALYESIMKDVAKILKHKLEKYAEN